MDFQSIVVELFVEAEVEGGAFKLISPFCLNGIPNKPLLV